MARPSYAGRLSQVLRAENGAFVAVRFFSLASFEVFDFVAQDNPLLSAFSRTWAGGEV